MSRLPCAVSQAQRCGLSRRSVASLGVGALWAAAWPGLAQGKQNTKVFRIGSLTLGPERMDDVLKDLERLGYVQGRNELAAELVRLKMGLIWAPSALAARAAMAATTTIPILMVSRDPVGAGLVASLARSGGNVTGFASLSVEMTGKRLQLLKELQPALARVAVLWDAAVPVKALEMAQIASAAKTLGLTIPPPVLLQATRVIE